MVPTNGSASLPDNWEEIFKEMTEDVKVGDSRKYKDLSNFDLADRINKIKLELRSLSEQIKARTPRGVELHGEMVELDEELRIRDFK